MRTEVPEVLAYESSDTKNGVEETIEHVFTFAIPDVHVLLEPCF